MADSPTPPGVPPRGPGSWGRWLAVVVLAASLVLRVIAWDVNGADSSQDAVSGVVRDLAIAGGVVLFLVLAGGLGRLAFVRKVERYAAAGGGTVLAIGPIDANHVAALRDLGMYTGSVNHSLVALVALPGALEVVGGYGDFETIAKIPYSAVRDCEVAVVSSRYRYTRGLELALSAAEVRGTVGIGMLGSGPFGLLALKEPRLSEAAAAVRARAFDGAAS